MGAKVRKHPGERGRAAFIIGFAHTPSRPPQNSAIALSEHVFAREPEMARFHVPKRLPTISKVQAEARKQPASSGQEAA